MLAPAEELENFFTVHGRWELGGVAPFRPDTPLTREEVLELWLELVLKQVQRWR